MTLDYIEKQAARLLVDVQRLRASVTAGQTPDADLLRHLRLMADGIKTATYHLKPLQ